MSLRHLRRPARREQITDCASSVRHSLWQRSRRRWAELRIDKPALLGLIWMALVVGAALLAPWVAPYDPSKQNLDIRLQAPAWETGNWSHPLGTDFLGRDVLSRLIFGARVSLLIGVIVVLIIGTVGVLVGLVAGYKGGRVDALIMRLVDTWISFPGLLLAIVVIFMIGPGFGSLVLTLSAVNWPVFARVTRGEVLATREAPYVAAAVIVGCRPRRIVFRHILPNLTSPLMTLAVLQFAIIILSEASLSFLGLGMQPPNTSWGLDIATGKEYIFTSWWLVTFPGLCIAFTVLATNLVAGWLRLVMDPYERDKAGGISLGTEAEQVVSHDRLLADVERGAFHG
jgi:peptide/nickel transport system permease protein